MRSIAVTTILACLCAASHADSRDETMYETWARDSRTGEFQAFLEARGVGNVAPLYQLLRTASDWHKCSASPFQIPPQSQWPAVVEVLTLLRELKNRQILQDFEAVSNYRSPELNDCAKGSPNSAHTLSFAIDIVMKGDPVNQEGLCEFWRTEGKAWKMGLSRYPSGRIHLDTTRYRTWGHDFTHRTSFCRPAP